MSTDRWMDKEIVLCVYNGILPSYKKEHIWVSPNELDEIRAYYTEWNKSQRERQMLSLHWRAYYDAVNSFLDSVEGDGMIWENGIETCIISYMKWIASPGSMHDAGCLGLVHWDDPEGWYGGGGFRMGNTCIPVADSCWYMAKPIQYCKVINLQLK